MKQILIPLLLAFALIHNSFAAISLLDSDQWKVLMSGFVETDSILDSTRSFNESTGNAPVLRPTVQSGQAGRYQMSIRNSRLAFTVLAPTKEDWKTKGYFEFDLLGFDSSPGASNSESAFFNSPTFRLRHGYVQVSNGGWDFLAGQTWMLLGWQPYYFMPTVQIAPIPAMLYNRTVQFRATKNFSMTGDYGLQAALGVMRPPQRDASLPGLESGIRLAYNGWTGGFAAGGTAADKVQPLSLGLSGAVRQFSVTSTALAPTGVMNHFTGSALALDTLIPIIPSHDGKDVGNTFVIGAEATVGTGDGDEFGSWTGNLSNPLNALGTAPNSNVAIDGGIGGFDVNQNFTLVDLKTLNFYAQYHFSSQTRTWLSAGASWLYSDNVAGLTNSASSASAVLYNKEQSVFANVFRNLSEQIRLGLEFAQIVTTYTDATIAHDNRVQLSAWFFF